MSLYNFNIDRLTQRLIYVSIFKIDFLNINNFFMFPCVKEVSEMTPLFFSKNLPSSISLN